MELLYKIFPELTFIDPVKLVTKISKKFHRDTSKQNSLVIFTSGDKTKFEKTKKD